MWQFVIDSCCRWPLWRLPVTTKWSAPISCLGSTLSFVSTLCLMRPTPSSTCTTTNPDPIPQVPSLPIGLIRTTQSLVNFRILWNQIWYQRFNCSKNSDQLTIAIIGLRYGNPPYSNLYGSCLLICEITIVSLGRYQIRFYSTLLLPPSCTTSCLVSMATVFTFHITASGVMKPTEYEESKMFELKRVVEDLLPVLMILLGSFSQFVRWG
mgnify:CR=1 FL=1